MVQAEKNKLIKGEGRKTKIECDGCGNKNSVRSSTIYKGKYLCHQCYLKETTPMPRRGFLKYNLREALEKVYEIKPWMNKRDKSLRTCNICPPTILLGRKVRLVLVK